MSSSTANVSLFLLITVFFITLNYFQSKSSGFLCAIHQLIFARHLLNHCCIIFTAATKFNKRFLFWDYFYCTNPVTSSSSYDQVQYPTNYTTEVIDYEVYIINWSGSKGGSTDLQSAVPITILEYLIYHIGFCNAQYTVHTYSTYTQRDRHTKNI